MVNHIFFLNPYAATVCLICSLQEGSVYDYLFDRTKYLWKPWLDVAQVRFTASMLLLIHFNVRLAVSEAY
jgi:hypothetical protein